MAGFTYSTLTTAIQNYTEVGTSVLSSTITDQFIDNSELRIQREIPIDADRREVIGNLVASKDNIHAPAGTLFVRDIQVYTSTTAATGANLAKAAGYSITVGKRDSAGDITNTEDFYHFTVDTNTATSGGVSGGGNSCSAGPATITA